MLVTLLVTALFIGLLSQLLIPGGAAALVILDYQGTPPPNYPFLYPFTIQNLTHLLLFLGLGEVFRRWRAAAQPLGVSFYTTLVALVESAILVLFMNLVQVREELAVNASGHYTLTNLINRLYAGG